MIQPIGMASYARFDEPLMPNPFGEPNSFVDVSPAAAAGHNAPVGAAPP